MIAMPLDCGMVERAVLEEIIEQHPLRLTIAELTRRLAADPDDDAEAKVLNEAILNLRRSELVRYRDDDLIVEPTYAAIRAGALFRT